MASVEVYMCRGLTLGAAYTSAIRDEQFALDAANAAGNASGLPEKWHKEFEAEMGVSSLPLTPTLGK